MCLLIWWELKGLKTRLTEQQKGVQEERGRLYMKNNGPIVPL